MLSSNFEVVLPSSVLLSYARPDILRDVTLSLRCGGRSTALEGQRASSSVSSIGPVHVAVPPSRRVVQQSSVVSIVGQSSSCRSASSSVSGIAAHPKLRPRAKAKTKPKAKAKSTASHGMQLDSIGFATLGFTSDGIDSTGEEFVEL
jgi:hypothetical protein